MEHIMVSDHQVGDWEEGFEGLMAWFLNKNQVFTNKQRAQLHKYCAYLYHSSGKINLIAEGDRRNLATKHILPSLAMVGLLATVPNAKVLDLGSGAGLPGIPLKIVFPESYFYLVESRRRRANFLREVSRKLELKRLEVCNDRIEALHDSLAQAVDVVVSRATKNLGELLDWVRPVLKPYGVLIATLDQGRGLQGAKEVILRRKSEWSGVVSWYGGVR